MKKLKLSKKMEEYRLAMMDDMYNILYEVQYAPAGFRDQTRRKYAKLIVDGILVAYCSNKNIAVEMEELWPISKFIGAKR